MKTAYLLSILSSSIAALPLMAAAQPVPLVPVPAAVVPSAGFMTIVIIRHAEKPAEGLGQLTCQGLNRSLALAPVLLKKYGRPVAIFATNPSQLKTDNGVAYPYIRPLATIEPLAIRVGMPVDIRWGMTEIDPLATQLLKATSGTQVVAWEHHWAESLARRLLARMNGAAADVPPWGDGDYDSAFVIRAEVTQEGFRGVTFAREQEGLDGLPTACATAEPPP